MSENLLEVRNLSKRFTSRGIYVNAVDNISFDIRSGETFALVGESGCGKTTTGRLILRLIEADSGGICFKGEDLTKLSKTELRKIRPDMQMIFQDPYSSLNPRMNTRRLLREAIEVKKNISKGQVDDKCREVIGSVGLELDDLNKYPHEFSGGQRQRISTARAIVNRPDLIICDEPVSALDLLVQAQMLNLLKSLQEEYNFSYLFISHDLSVVKHMASRIAIMYKGSIVEMGSKEDIFDHAKHPYTKLLLDSRLELNPDKSLFKDNDGLFNRNTDIGDVPCKFASRCKYLNEACRGRDMYLENISQDHLVMCTKYY